MFFLTFAYYFFISVRLNLKILQNEFEIDFVELTVPHFVRNDKQLAVVHHILQSPSHFDHRETTK